jgi:phospholipid/cholesterol/gamma-HCH transport system ATP-binding protein
MDITCAEEKELNQYRQNIGVLFQSGALFSSMTIKENIELPLQEYTDLDSATINTIIKMKLGMVNLAGYENYHPSELSGGMKKRAGIARAMALDPRVLFFDELSAGLDPVTAAELDDLIIKTEEALGTTMVIVTHELESIYKIAHRVIMLDKEAKGIIAEGKPLELKEQSTDPRVKSFFLRQKPATPDEQRFYVN